MQRNGSARDAVLPPTGSKYGTWPTTRRNEDILADCGLTSGQIQALNTRAQARAMDALSLLCEDRGVSNVTNLLM